MFRTIADFESAWKKESEATLIVLRALTDASLTQRVTPTGRSLGALAWHITTSLTGMTVQARLLEKATVGPEPTSAQAIVDIYESDAKRIAEAVQEKWTDAQLGDEIAIYGEQWAKGFTLVALISHQSHHRGQMTVLMRQAGLKVPGVCGPAYEEWAATGMAPQA